MGKTIFITGGGRGLGRATAERLMALGHRVFTTLHSQHSAPAGVEAFQVDLSSFASIRTLGEKLAGASLDVVFHCAGVMQQSPTRRLTVDGIEETLAVNALAPFLLTHLLWPALLRTPAPRVVNVSSRMHLPGSRGAEVRFDFDDPNLSANYEPDRAYKNSKLALLWVTYELDRRARARGLSQVTSNAVCPGFVPATGAASTHGVLKLMMTYVLPHMSFARSVDEAVDSFVFMALDPSLDAKSGAFYGEKHPIESSPESYDAGKAARFCTWAGEVTGVAQWP